MANPLVHSRSSVRLWGGVEEDYLPIHNKMDCSKAYFSDNRHRRYDLLYTFFCALIIDAHLAKKFSTLRFIRI